MYRCSRVVQRCSDGVVVSRVQPSPTSRRRQVAFSRLNPVVVVRAGRLVLRGLPARGVAAQLFRPLPAVAYALAVALDRVHPAGRRTNERRVSADDDDGGPSRAVTRRSRRRPGGRAVAAASSGRRRRRSIHVVGRRSVADVGVAGRRLQP